MAGTERRGHVQLLDSVVGGSFQWHAAHLAFGEDAVSHLTCEEDIQGEGSASANAGAAVAILNEHVDGEGAGHWRGCCWPPVVRAGMRGQGAMQTMRRLILAVAIGAVGGVCGTLLSAQERADLALFNGSVFPADGSAAVYSTIVVRDGRVLALGGTELLGRYRAGPGR